jgi:hypothetical protein
MSRETLAVVLLVAAATACAAPAGPRPVESVETTAARPPSRPVSVEAIELLRSWDQRRADAWSRGDPRLLRPLYTPGSAAGRRDRAMLRTWAGRGLAVRDLRTQLLAVRELGHTTTTWTLLVTDRVAGAVAVGPGVRWPLPRDQPTTRVIRLRRVGGDWRVAAVRLGTGAGSGGR